MDERISQESPFSLQAEAAYQHWRAQRLAYPLTDLAAATVAVQDLGQLTAQEAAALRIALQHYNMVRYRCAQPISREALLRFGATLGLRRTDAHLCAEEDGISLLQVSAGEPAGDYIPYTDRPLSWHCDGYYNRPEERIRAMLLHCVQPAWEGGENALLDPEWLYIVLRDENPDWIAALMHPQAMTIPANRQGDHELRPERTGPVFSVDPATGALHMRYTARRRHVVWREDPATQAAVQRIEAFLQEPNPLVLRCRLDAGEGILCHNVLHNRTGFRDSPNAAGPGKRLMYRVRFFDRVPAGFASNSGGLAYASPRVAV